MGHQKFKLKLIILSAILLTLSSGLLFYRQLFIDEIKSEFQAKADLEELRYLDQQINSSLLSMRINLNQNSDEILQNKNRINDILNIVFDMRKNNPEVRKSLIEIKSYFADKNTSIEKYLMAVRELQANLKSLNPIYTELQKNNVKFSLEGNDFYRECINDSLLFLITPSKDIEWRFNEDIKILTQIMSFSKVPNPIIEKYFKAMNQIQKRAKEIENLIEINKEKSISNQISYVIKYDSDSKELGHTRGQTFLLLVFFSIVAYISTIIFVIRKL